MSKTNCINCGAAKDTSEIKCPFCGTTYLDLTAIDFSSDDPVVCEFVLPYTEDRVVLSMLARPQLDYIDQSSDVVDCVDPTGYKLISFERSRSVDIGVSFKPICGKDNTLFKLKTIKAET